MSAVGGAGGARNIEAREVVEDAAETGPSTGSGRTEAEAAAERSRDRLADLPFASRARVREICAKPLAEPSGIAYHASRKSLFVVGDRGHIAEISREGAIIRKERIGKLDFEGVTVGPRGNLFVVSEEKPPRLIEIDPETLAVRRSMKIDPDLDGKRVIARRENDGLEGLCYVAEDDAFYALNQDRPPRIVRLSLPEKKNGKVRIEEAIELPSDVKHGSDLTYDPETRHFLVSQASDDGKRGAVHELTRNGRLVRTLALPGERQEGLALGPSGTAWIAQDSGGVLEVRTP
jgi:uncharacterized protein YjiK